MSNRNENYKRWQASTEFAPIASLAHSPLLRQPLNEPDPVAVEPVVVLLGGGPLQDLAQIGPAEIKVRVSQSDTTKKLFHWSRVQT